MLRIPRRIWARLQPGAWNTVLVFHVDNKDPRTRLIHCLPRAGFSRKLYGMQNTRKSKQYWMLV